MTEQTTRNANTEGKAVLEAIMTVPADAPTACAEWTAHDLVAHLAAGAKEVTDLVEDKLEGRAERPTRGFDEREAPFRALDHDALVEQLVVENKRKLRAFAALVTEPDPSIAFTGTRVEADRLGTHSRSEASIHRWDLVGDDNTSRALLAQPDLTAHAAWVLDAMPVLDESTASIAKRLEATGRDTAAFVFRSDGHDDVTLLIQGGAARYAVAKDAPHADVVVSTRADHRLLMLWGRRPQGLDVEVAGDPQLCDALRAALWPNAVNWQ
jgi:uncharacterized protein (TIGR03083 family)